MDRQAIGTAKGSAKTWQHPWLTAEDYALICRMPPEPAYKFMAFLHAQARADARFHAHMQTSLDLEQLDGRNRSNAMYGAGGGRSRHPEGPGPF